ncbi:MAG: PDZ domain-containing protein [Prevotellaceae bacterium]|jgi:tricorn protease|nr:PDZ domain-containing protein [Prevotellaceae bacterium]
MNRLSIFVTTTVLAFSAATAGHALAASEARLLRFPATNGQEIAFSYAGDLYRVSINGGEAVRLTSHIGYEMFPRYSPDGKTIAFTGQYDGNTEVYSLPATGGEPLRLTYSATNARDDLGDRMGPNNIVMTWTPDGSSIVYRNRIGDGFIGKLWQVSPQGGMPQPIPLPEGGFCSYSPDGKALAYNRTMREFRTWKHYQGGQAAEVWVYDTDKQSVERLTDNPAQDIFPMWDGDNIFFLSDRSYTLNLFVYNRTTKQTEQVTRFDDYDIKFPSIHGHTIVFEKGGYLYKFDTRTRQSEQVTVTLASDNIYARSEVKSVADQISHSSLSPDGSRLAITARGDVFDVPATKGVTRNITRSPGAHERNADWAPDGKSIAYISDATGETELYLHTVANGKTEQLTRNNDTYIRSFTWSPDARQIAYTDRKNRIVLLDVASKQKRTVAEEPLEAFGAVAFSPDSRWLTYTRPASNMYNVVFLYNIATRKEYAVTDKWYSSDAPLFSSDGKYLVFTSDRDFNPTYGSLEWNHVYNNMGNIYLALLDKDTPSPFLTPDPQVNAQPAKVGSDSLVGIDPDGIADRILSLPIRPGRPYPVYADANRIYYYVQGKTKCFDLKTQKEEEVSDGYMSVPNNRQPTHALFGKGNNLYVTSLPTGRVNLTEAVYTADITVTTDYPKEWAQIFNEAWRAFRDGFYLSNMHGIDWQAMKEKYAPLVPHVKNRIDLNYVIGEMIGELTCGHAYINLGEYNQPARLKTGMLGAEMERDASSGFFRLKKILEGASWSRTLRSPLTEPGVKVQAGDYIVAIDGVPTNTVKNIYALLVGKAGIRTELSVNSQPKAAGAHKVVITPIDNEYPLYHHAWIQNNIRRVDEASGGKIGYIYIPDMGVEGLNEFSRYFYPQLDKEGLIIDDRGNGGGNVSPMILERLSREAYRLTMQRSSTHVGTIPDATLVGPKVCLIDKYSASDGDLFPWGFRALGLGKLIGMRTWGGIIGIGGSLPFIDGTDIRVPMFTSYDAKTGAWIIENHGVDPDITVDNDPVKEWNGEDRQLDAAIQEVLKELKNRKPLPPVPAPRNWKNGGASK